MLQSQGRLFPFMSIVTFFITLNVTGCNDDKLL
jgi:hypothetical protein